ncbi:F-box/WD repeat-containing protein 7 [Dictyocoela muelleri]|nr:F-box/WD repeat-containing protein 7 [Dictyocoela muelleri]
MISSTDEKIKNKKIKLIRNIPIELLSSIMIYMPDEIIDNLSKKFKKVSNNYIYWRNRCYPLGLPIFRTTTHFRNRITEYKKQELIIKNGNIDIKEIEAGTKDITAMVVQKDKIIISSDDAKIKIYEKFKEKFVLNGHKGGVWAIDCGEMLISGGVDKTIRIWDMNLGIAKRILNSHKGTVRCISTYDNFIASGSRDTFVKVWTINGKLIAKLRGHTESVRCITMNKKYILSGSYDGSVILWSYPKITKKNLQPHTSRVYSVLLGKSHAVSGSRDGTVFITDLTNFGVYKLDAHCSIVTALTFSYFFNDEWVEKYIFTSGEDGILCKWDFSGNLIYKIKERNRIVTHVHFNNFIVIATEHCVRVYSSETGLYVRDIIDELFTIYEMKIVDGKIIIGCRDNQMTKLIICSFTD